MLWRQAYATPHDVAENLAGPSNELPWAGVVARSALAATNMRLWHALAVAEFGDGGPLAFGFVDQDGRDLLPPSLADVFRFWTPHGFPVEDPRWRADQPLGIVIDSGGQAGLWFGPITEDAWEEFARAARELVADSDR